MENEIHISDIRSFRSCRRKWQWSSPLKENLEQLVTYMPFFTGRAIHHCLEKYYGPEHANMADSLEKFFETEKAVMEQLGALWPQEVASIDEQLFMMHELIQHYNEWIVQDHKMYSDSKLEFISLEQEFKVPLPRAGRGGKSLTLGGRFDGIVRHKETGEYWIFETKTTRSIQELVHSLANDEQCGVYLYAAQKMFNVPIVGILYNIMRKKSPAHPGVLVNSMLSQAKSMDTTAFHYLGCIRNNHPDWSNDTIQEFYGDTLAMLLDNEQKFFMRFPVYRTPYEVKMLMQGVYWTAVEMTRPSTYIYPSPSWLNCNFCSFRAPCLAMNAGSDYQVLLDAEFQKRDASKSLRSSIEEDGNGKES
jgi:hypothetical protein